MQNALSLSSWLYCGISQILLEVSYQLKGGDGGRPGAEPMQGSDHWAAGAAWDVFWSAGSSHSRFITTRAPGEAVRTLLSLPGWGKASPNTWQPVWPDSSLNIQILKARWVPAQAQFIGGADRTSHELIPTRTRTSIILQRLEKSPSK